MGGWAVGGHISAGDNTTLQHDGCRSFSPSAPPGQRRGASLTSHEFESDDNAAAAGSPPADNNV